MPTVLRTIGRQEYALKALETAIAMGHRTAPGYAELGELLEDLGRHEEAASARRSAVELKSGCLGAGIAPVACCEEEAPRPTADNVALEGWHIPEPWRQVQLVLIEPDNYPHSAALSDLVAAFSHAFTRLGIRTAVVRNTFSKQGMNVVFGAHLIDSRSVADVCPPTRSW